MLKILYVNLDRSSAIELIGNMKIEILLRIRGISTVFVYSSQDCSRFERGEIFDIIQEKKIDLLIVEEGIFKYAGMDNPEIKQRFLNLHIPTILMSQCYQKEEYGMYDYVLSHYTHPKHPSYLYLPLSPGNTIRNYRYKKRKECVCISRAADERFDKQLLQQVIDRFGEIDYYSFTGEEKAIPGLNFEGKFIRKNISAILNSYKYIILPYQECLCLPLREALMCGTVPIILDMESYYKKNITYADQFLRFCCDMNDRDEVLEEKHNILETKMIEEMIHDFLSFDRMVFTLFVYLKAITNKDLRWNYNSEQIANVEFLHASEENGPKRIDSTQFAINWKSVKLG